jgi:BASS family bile acid:Na+ symporter
MQKSILADVVLPIALALIMLGMGLSLIRADFKRVFKFPKAVVVGLVCQMLILPVVGWAVVNLIKMDNPELAVGLMVLTFCPGGATSNMLSFLARGDVALSITLTAVVSMVTPFTIPIFTALAMTSLMGEGQSIALPIPKTIGALLLITVVPVGIGMFIRAKKPDFAAKAEKPVKIASIVILFAIIAALVKKNSAELGSFFAQTGLPVLVLNVTTMAIGFFAARAAKLNHKQQVTIGMEVGIQNGTTAILVTQGLLGNSVMAVSPAIYSLVMFVTGGLFGYLVNLGKPKEPVPEKA